LAFVVRIYDLVESKIHFNFGIRKINFVFKSESFFCKQYKTKIPKDGQAFIKLFFFFIFENDSFKNSIPAFLLLIFDFEPRRKWVAKIISNKKCFPQILNPIPAGVLENQDTLGGGLI